MALQLQRLRILVVEDNNNMRELIASVLDNLGIGRVFTASGGNRVFELMQENEPDIVILDWQMPEMDGLDVTRMIRKDPESPDPFIPIIVITGYNSLERVKIARDAGVTEFLIKPFKATDVAKRIEHVINHPRDFVSTADFFGPDRRRKIDKNYNGPKRRKEDKLKALDW